MWRWGPQLRGTSATEPKLSLITDVEISALSEAETSSRRRSGRGAVGRAPWVPRSPGIGVVARRRMPPGASQNSKPRCRRKAPPPSGDSESEPTRSPSPSRTSLLHAVADASRALLSDVAEAASGQMRRCGLSYTTHHASDSAGGRRRVRLYRFRTRYWETSESREKQGVGEFSIFEKHEVFVWPRSGTAISVSSRHAGGIEFRPSLRIETRLSRSVLVD